jgi:preprotein translocase subunit SecB
MAAPCLLLHYCEQILEPYFRSLIKWYVVFCYINPLRLICNVDVVGC